MAFSGPIITTAFFTASCFSVTVELTVEDRRVNQGYIMA